MRATFYEHMPQHFISSGIYNDRIGWSITMGGIFRLIYQQRIAHITELAGFDQAAIEALSGRSCTFEQKLEQMIDLTADGYEEVMKAHMPSCLYRDFCLWGVAQQNPDRPAVMQRRRTISQENFAVSSCAEISNPI
jgi:hypothetical protein